MSSMIGTDIDLGAYFNRIGYRGDWKPTLEALRAIVSLHPAAIPFEAIDVLIGKGIDLSAQAVDAKLIAMRRGGYCFEHNSLLRRVLTAMGYDAVTLLGRVYWMEKEVRVPPRTHMAVMVWISGIAWLCDVGFGSLVPTSPLRMDVTEAQTTAHGAFRVLPSREGYQLEALLSDGWVRVYDLGRTPQVDADVEAANWFVATHPSSLFRRELIIARTTLDARFTLLGHRLTTRTVRGEKQTILLAPGELRAVLRTLFAVPECRELNTLLLGVRSAEIESIFRFPILGTPPMAT